MLTDSSGKSAKTYMSTFATQQQEAMNFFIMSSQNWRVKKNIPVGCGTMQTGWLIDEYVKWSEC